MTKGILLVNLGTPDSPDVRDVRKYLMEFLNDPLVMDLHPILRFFLVHFIILPFRVQKSAALYKKIWTENGSPLLIHGKNVKELLQKKLSLAAPASSGKSNDYAVELAMRYQQPSIEIGIRKLVEAGVDEIIVLPMYPQYATSSTESTLQEVKRVAKKLRFNSLKSVNFFYNHSLYIDACVESTKKYDFNEYDFFLFSYHGLPERQIRKVYPLHCKINEVCCSRVNEKNELCYRAACYETTRQLAKRLNIPEAKYSTSFQSRLDDRWLKPYSDKVVEEKAKQGVKKMLVFSPAFVADCLETIYEIGIEYNQIFLRHGGEKLQLVESLNSNPKWIEALKDIALNS